MLGSRHPKKGDQIMSRIFVTIASITSLIFFASCDNKKDTKTPEDNKIAGNLRVLSANERAADFDQLLQMFKSYYGPYQLKEQTLGINIEKLATDLKSQAQEAKTDEEFMGYVMQFGAALQDGHVQFAIENSASNVGRYVIPIVLTTVEDKAIVGDIEEKLAAFSEISKGDEILSVDGKTPQEWAQIALKYRRTARELSDKQILVNAAINRRSYMTDIIPTSPMAEIKFKNADGETRVISLPWTKQKYNAKLDGIITPPKGALDLSVPYISDMNTIDTHVNQMGQVDPVFLTPQTKKAYGFVQVYPSDASRAKFGLKDPAVKPEIYAALYKYQGKTILLVRQNTYSPEDYPTGAYMRAYQALMSEYEAFADVLVLDKTHNPGGSYCADFYDHFANEGDVQSVEKVRADRKWINDFTVNYPNEIGDDSPWDVKSLMAWGSIVESAYDRGDFLTEPIPLFNSSSYTTPRQYTWKKPMLVLIDELAGSCGDMFPMLVKANKRAKLFGQNTMGLGGNVEQVGQLNNSRIAIRMTRGLFHPYRPDGAYRPADLVENNGVAPDVAYSHTVADIRKGYVGYVKAFSEEAIKQIAADGSQVPVDAPAPSAPAPAPAPADPAPAPAPAPQPNP
jgi:C-terminal processing protease CtpA/Prc